MESNLEERFNMKTHWTTDFKWLNEQLLGDHGYIKDHKPLHYDLSTIYFNLFHSYGLYSQIVHSKTAGIDLFWMAATTFDMKDRTVHSRYKQNWNWFMLLQANRLLIHAPH